MSRNGSGGYSLPSNSWNPAVNGVTATAADWQALINDVATAIQQSISADGQTPITGNLAMGGNKLTGLAAGSGTGQSLRYEQLFSQGALTDIASAATTDIGTPLSNFLRVTGATGITSFGTNYNGPRFLIFAGAVLLTHSATLVLPTGANITTAANDALIAVPISGGWQVVAYQKANGSPLAGGDLLNTTRIDVASAATVDLTANAPSTRNINITGTTTITGFTVAIGQTYFVRFAGALTLTNNANIVTQSGANITTRAGDTCIIRSTAANTVEVLSYVSYGYRTGDLIQTQTYTDAGSSTTSTSYTNVSASVKNFTPLSTNSRIILECVFYVNVTITGGVNTTGSVVFYDGASTFGYAQTYGASSSSGGVGFTSSGSLMWELPNSALTTRNFSLRALSSFAGNTVTVQNHFWKVYEVQA